MTRRRAASLFGLLVLLASLALTTISARGQGRANQTDSPQQTSPPAREETAAQSTGRAEATLTDESAQRTAHSIRIEGREVKYTSTAGRLPIRLDDEKVAARMFFVAYTKDGEDPRTRPISFLYNGGPGSATIWLHMGSFGPRHVQMADDGFQPVPPFHLMDNENSLLDVSDLVFIDAVDTGYSRIAGGVNPSQFHGQNGDLRAFGEFINAYLVTYNRWLSPKFLIGESYGTIRSAGLSRELQTRHGIELSGIVLISSLLTYQTLSPAPDNDVAYQALIQTYAADAWYHKKLPADLQKQELKAVVDQARTFAFGEYAQALTKGNTWPPAERAAVAQ